MFRLPKISLVLTFLGLLLFTPAMRADQFTATGFIPTFNNSGGGHYTFDTTASGDPIGDVTGSGSFDLSATGDITNGDVVYVDVNGDLLELNFQGSIDASGAFVETFTIVGGTGQWDGATGSGMITGQLNSDGSANYAIDGEIDLP
jgi:hypothetical protein